MEQLTADIHAAARAALNERERPKRRARIAELELTAA